MGMHGILRQHRSATRRCRCLTYATANAAGRRQPASSAPAAPEEDTDARRTVRRAPSLRLRALPKAEVHVQLEGCFEPATLEQWARDAGVPTPRARESLLQFQGLADLLHFLDWGCSLADSPERLAGMAARLQPAAARRRHRLCRPDRQAEPLETVARPLAPDARCAACRLHRGRTGRPAAGGGCASACCVRKARRWRWSWSMRWSNGAMRAIEDPAMVERLRQRRIPLGVCPSSNLVLKVYATLDQHPIDALRRAGVPVSIDTDAPSLPGTTLPAQYAPCPSDFGWSDEVVREIAATSIEASFANDDLKARPPCRAGALVALVTRPRPARGR
jgi:hypothetical protein